MEQDFYTVNYRKIAEFEIDDDVTVLGIDFDNEEQATKFYDTIVEGNACGEGYFVELLHYFNDSVVIVGRYEF